MDGLFQFHRRHADPSVKHLFRLASDLLCQPWHCVKQCPRWWSSTLWCDNCIYREQTYNFPIVSLIFTKCQHCCSGVQTIFRRNATCCIFTYCYRQSVCVCPCVYVFVCVFVCLCPYASLLNQRKTSWDKSTMFTPSCWPQKSNPTTFGDVVAHDLDLLF